MRGYLFDNNHVSAMFDKETSVIEHLESILPEHLVRVCTITLGEIEAGHSMTHTTNQNRRDDFIAFVNKKFLPYAIEISISTRIYYSQILGRIWKKYPPIKQKKSTEKHLVDLGVDINDVWTVAVAWEHGLIFVTDDKMTCIREIVELDVEFQNWRVR